MKGDQIGTLTAHPSLQELSISNWTWFRPVRAGGGRGLRAALGGGAPIRRAQADGRHGRDVAAGPQNAPALAAPGPDRPRTACPTDRAGGAGGARASAGRWLAQAGDADAGPGQGRACPPVRRYPGLPPRARNPQENRPCSWSRTARERRRRITSGSNPRPPPYRSRKRRDQTRTAGAAAPRNLETRVPLRSAKALIGRAPVVSCRKPLSQILSMTTSPDLVIWARTCAPSPPSIAFQT